MTTADGLCEAAHLVLDGAEDSDNRRRAAALLGRQAIERRVAELLDREGPTPNNWRLRFVVLAALQPDARPRVAHELWTWWSEVVHYDPCDTVPPAGAIRLRIDETAAWLAASLSHLTPSDRSERA